MREAGFIGRNPAVEDQATDRTYRIGQTRTVLVHRLISLGTFEEKINAMMASKRELAELAVATGESSLSEFFQRGTEGTVQAGRLALQPPG